MHMLLLHERHNEEAAEKYRKISNNSNTLLICTPPLFRPFNMHVFSSNPFKQILYLFVHPPFLRIFGNLRPLINSYS